MPLNVPILITWLRILMIPLVIGVFYVPELWLSMWHKNVIATAMFAAAAVTDWLDGYLARRLNQTSAFGAFLDPVADKLMIAAALNFLGKIKTISQMIAVPLLLYNERIGVFSPQRVGTWLIYLAAILTLVSMFHYLKLALAPRAPGDRRRLDRRGSGP